MAGCTWRGRSGCPFIFPPAVVWHRTSDQNCSATSPSASCFKRALYQPRPCDAMRCHGSPHGLLLSMALHSLCQAAVHHLWWTIRTARSRRQPLAAPEHRQMPRQSRPVGHQVLAAAPLLTPQPRLLRRRFASSVAAAVVLSAVLPAAVCPDADLLYGSRICWCVGFRNQMTSPAQETLACCKGQDWRP